MSYTEEQLRDLVERTHRIRQLTKTPDWQLYADWLIACLEPKQRALLSGSMDDMLRYKQEAGFIQGAMFALHAADELERQLARAQEIVQDKLDAEADAA